jgi:hypothetical protein
MNKFLRQTRLKTRTATCFFFAHSFGKEAVCCEIRGKQHENNKVKGRQVCAVDASESKVRMS